MWPREMGGSIASCAGKTLKRSSASWGEGDQRGRDAEAFDGLPVVVTGTTGVRLTSVAAAAARGDLAPPSTL